MCKRKAAQRQNVAKEATWGVAPITDVRPKAAQVSKTWEGEILRTRLVQVLPGLNFFWLDWAEVSWAEPVPYYLEEQDRDGFPKRLHTYDLGRVHYFVQQIEKKAEITPIDVSCEGSSVYVVDGYHRMSAFLLMGTKKIPARVEYSDPACVDWLRGKTNVKPAQLKKRLSKKDGFLKCLR